MSEFVYTELLPLGPDETPYRRVESGGIGSFTAGGHRFVTVEPGVLTRLTALAMHEIAHYLRPGHLGQLRAIFDDPEASANDRFVALDLLKNACISAGGVLTRLALRGGRGPDGDRPPRRQPPALRGPT